MLNAPWTSAPSRCVVGRRARDVDGCAPARHPRRDEPETVHRRFFSPRFLSSVWDGPNRSIDEFKFDLRPRVRRDEFRPVAAVLDENQPLEKARARRLPGAPRRLGRHSRRARLRRRVRDDAMYGGDRGYGGYGGGADRGGFGVSGSRAFAPSGGYGQTSPRAQAGAGGRPAFSLGAAAAPPVGASRGFQMQPQTSGGYGQDAGGTGVGSRLAGRCQHLATSRWTPAADPRADPPADPTADPPPPPTDSAPPPGSCAGRARP